MRSPAERLRDMLEAIGHIERYAIRGRAAFDRDELIQSWFVRHLQILGEAARLLPEEFRSRNPEIEWKKIIGMRHVLVHDYFGIDRDVVWSTIERDIPTLKSRLIQMIDRSREA